MESSEMDSLRKPWESDETWNLRKSFLQRHWEDKTMTRNRLICLSQIFVNVEFLGCKYDEELMAKVKEMGEGLGEERRERLRAVAEQLFAKGGKTTEKYGGRSANKKVKQSDEGEPSTKRSTRDASAPVVVTTTHPVCAIKMKVLQSLKGELMVMQQQRLPDDPLTVLNQATGRSKCRWRIDFNEEQHSCKLQVDDVLVTEQVYWGSQTRSRTEACRRAVEILQRPFFDVRQVTDKVVSPALDLDLELFTRRENRSDWDSPAIGRFEPLEQAFTALRKRIAAVPLEARNGTPKTCLEENAFLNDLPVEMKRQHMGGWKEEIIVTVGKVELCRHQGRIPPKGKETESARECYLTAIDFLMKPTFGDGICVTETNGVLAITPKQKSSPEKLVVSDKVTERRRSSLDQGNDPARKELSLKSVRLHLNATSDTMNPVQRIEQSCTKAKVPYDVVFAPDSSFSAAVFVDGVQIASATDTKKKEAKAKACLETIRQLLQPYIRIQQNESEDFTLESSQEPFDE